MKKIQPPILYTNIYRYLFIFMYVTWVCTNRMELLKYRDLMST